MVADLEAAVAGAEGLALAGDFEGSSRAVAELSAGLSAAARPNLLARAAWVAALGALVGGDMDEFKTMTRLAGDALEMFSDHTKRIELEQLAHRMTHLRRIVELDSDLDAIMTDMFRDHAALLVRMNDTGDLRMWKMVDAERADWPMLFAAVRERLGRPCAAELAVQRTAPDAVGAVIVAVLLGLGPDHEVTPDGLATLCFAAAPAIAMARTRIDDLIAAGHLQVDGAHVRIIEASD